MGSSKTTVTKNPYGPSQPLFNQTAGILKDYMNNPASNAVYDGQRSVDPSAYTQQGIDAMANNQGYQQARDYYTKTLNGDYLSPDNSYLKNLQSSVQSAVMPGVNATFAKSGMLGSTLHQGSLTRALTDGMAAPMFANYQNERGMQNAAAGALPGLDQSRAQALMAAGQATEGYQREKMAADWQKWQETQDAPLKALSKAYPYISDMGKQGGVSTQTTSSNPWQTAAGIGMAGLGMLSGGGFGGASGLMSGAQAASLYNPYAGQGYGYSAAPASMGFKIGGN